MKNQLYSATLFFTFLLSLSLYAADYSNLKSTLENKMKAAQVTALQMAIQEEGQVVFSTELGFLDASQAKLTTEDSLFFSASLTKMLTAAALFQLSERGVIELNDPVVEYIPWLRLHPSPQAQRITVGQVMSHTSGMARNGISFWTDLERQEKEILPSEEELIRSVLAQTFATVEGSRIKYSNIGYELLGYLVGTVCDRCRGATKSQRYINYVKRNILAPLGMTKSGFVPTALQQADFAAPYGSVQPDGVRKIYNLLPGTGASVGAWGLFTRAADFMKFMQEIRKVILKQANKLFVKDFSDLISQPVHWDMLNPGLGHSYGFRIIKTNQGLLVGHTGTFPGYSAAAFVSVEDGAIGVAFLNAVDAGAFGYLMEAFKAKSGQVQVTEASQLPQPVVAPAIPTNPFAHIVRTYTYVFGAFQIIFENDRYFIMLSGQKVPLYLNLTPAGDYIEGRIGTNAGYLDPVGDSIRFKLGQDGVVEKMVVANSIITFPK